MRRTRKKSISILVALTFLLSMVFVYAGPALAAGSIQALSAPTVADGATQRMGMVRIDVPAGAIRAGDTVIFSLPSGFDFAEPTGTPNNTASWNDNFGQSVAGQVYSGGYNDAGSRTVFNYVVVPATVGGEDNGLAVADLQVRQIGRREVQITAGDDQDPGLDGVLYIVFDRIVVESGTTKDCTVTFDGPAGTGFPLGSVVIGRASEKGQVELTASSSDTSNSSFDFKLRIKETRAGSLEPGNKTIKLELPDGYVWDNDFTTAQYVYALWGQNIWITTKADDEVLEINFEGVDLDGDGVLDSNERGEATTVASAWDILKSSGASILDFSVDDESKVEAGDIMAKVSGESNIAVKEIKVGTYGEFGATIGVDGDVPTLFAGQDGQEIAKIVIKESLMESLVEGRTITLTLPEGARWQPAYEAETDDEAGTTPNDGAHNLPDFDEDEGLEVDFVRYTGTDYRTARFEVAEPSNDNGAEITLEDVEVALEAGFEGDLVVEVGGSAGLTGEIVVAKVVSPVAASASDVPSVVIGAAGQAAGSVTITENGAGALAEDEDVVLDLPTDVEFDGTPTVEVTQGNLRISNIRRQANNNQVAFTVDRKSSTASTIKVSNIKLKLYRTVPEGDVKLAVQGPAVVTTDALSDWVNSNAAVRVAIAKVTTPAEGIAAAKVVFTIGSTTMKVDGQEVTMDVAPYIDAATGRTYVPVRYAAQALGVAPENIFYDRGVVTLLKDVRAVQMTIGSKALLINGVTINMDAAPVIQNGRTMLPFRWVAMAFGAKVTYDETQKTVTMEL